MRNNVQRLSAVLFAALAYLAFIIINAFNLFSYHTVNLSPIECILFGFFALASFLFFSVGSLVWLYARDRRVALLLFCFSLVIMGALTPDILNASNDIFVDSIGGISSILAIPLASALLLLFPHDYFSYNRSGVSADMRRARRPKFSAQLLQGYFWFISALASVDILVQLLSDVQLLQIPSRLRIIFVAYYAVGLIGILIIIVSSYFHAFSMRERQQFRFFVSGVVLSISPALLFTVMPILLGLPEKYSIDNHYTEIAFLLFPITLAYSILRYQILVLDSYVRRAVSYIVGIICLALLVYFVIALYNILLHSYITNNVFFYFICVICVTAVLAPCVWWFARMLTDLLFFNDTIRYRRLIENPLALVEETLTLTDASRLLTSAAIDTFETTQSCLFVFDETSAAYCVFPPCTDDPADSSRRALMQSIVHALKPSDVGQDVDWLEEHLPAIQRLATARRPLLLSETIRTKEDAPKGLSRYLTAGSGLGDEDWLLAPVRAQGKMIGVLVLGERGDHQLYAGPDFEVVQMLAARFSSILEAARLYTRASQQAELLNSLYSMSLVPGSTFKSINDVVDTYVLGAATAANAGAEMWLYDERIDVLHCVSVSGSGPRISLKRRLQLPAPSDWSSLFFDGKKSQNMLSSILPSCLSLVPDFPFAWLPLLKNDKRLGLLVLTYTRPHFFMKEEMGVWEMFASQCVAALENVRMTAELLEAYERQKELDYLKDRFIMTASHELRTPLTAVLGYVELLNEYNDTLSFGERANFIERARRGCDELTLLVGNIMDASSVQMDVESLKLSQTSLLSSVLHVLEILESTIKREQRTITLAIPQDLVVTADDIRLRQILLNLVTNALRYSEIGTAIEITALLDEAHVIISIRDYGLGIPQEEQSRVFDRFVRLERDLNSPIRGTGLGLAICKQLITAMNGHIWVESSGEAGAGSSFNFTLRLDSSDITEKRAAIQLRRK